MKYLENIRFPKPCKKEKPEVSPRLKDINVLPLFRAHAGQQILKYFQMSSLMIELHMHALLIDFF